MRSARRWPSGWKNLRREPGLVGLEVVVEDFSKDPGAALSIPWNLVFDELPGRYRAAFEAGTDVERWRPFWSARYILTCGRRVDPFKRMPSWINPRVLVVVDPSVATDSGKTRGSGWIGSWPIAASTPVTSRWSWRRR